MLGLTATMVSLQLKRVVKYFNLTKLSGSITLLFQRQGQPGLEILTSRSLWSPVPVNPPGTEDDPFPPILINIGDLMHFWTN